MINHDISYDSINQKDPHLYKKITAVIFIVACALLIAIVVATTTNTTYRKNCSVISTSAIINDYPTPQNKIYGIEFNTTIMQANYIYYIGTKGSNGCSDCNYFRVDPYGINILRHDTYTNTGYDRGHIVPNADYGYDTYIITNVVPMIPEFNRDEWAASENMLRKQYANKLIYKGCDYDDLYITNDG